MFFVQLCGAGDRVTTHFFFFGCCRVIFLGGFRSIENGQYPERGSVGGLERLLMTKNAHSSLDRRPHKLKENH